MVKFDRSAGGAELRATEDGSAYSKAEMDQLLVTIDAGNRHVGGLKLVAEGELLMGCIKFLHGHYLVLVTKAQLMGNICGHSIYRTMEIKTFPIFHYDALPFGREHPDERRYRRIFEVVTDTNDFYWSYTYPLQNTLQFNSLDLSDHQPGASPIINHRFAWNAFLSLPLRRSRVAYARWVQPVIHGFFHQVYLSIFGRTIALTLIARRSRHFAGTRYRKRGVNAFGQVANDVETEQIVDGIRMKAVSLSSAVQIRGSIPLVWTQETNPLNPKPDIVLQQNDPEYLMTKSHFDDLKIRYGNPVVALNLIKSVERRPRETILRTEYARTVDFLNARAAPDQSILFVHWDFNQHTARRGANVLSVITPILQACLEKTGIFCCQSQEKVPEATAEAAADGEAGADAEAGAGAGEKLYTLYTYPQVQSGVLRTNCIDCLDRTNVAQFAFGLVALGKQLKVLGITDSPDIDPGCGAALQLMAQYEAMGDVLSLQYGGSEAHSKFFQRQKGSSAYATKSRDIMTSFLRYYSNSYGDSMKQDAMNLFLGHFCPEKGKPQLWELETDHYLPNLYQPHASAPDRYAPPSGYMVDHLGVRTIARATAGPQGEGQLPDGKVRPARPAELATRFVRTPPKGTKGYRTRRHSHPHSPGVEGAAHHHLPLLSFDEHFSQAPRTIHTSFYARPDGGPRGGSPSPSSSSLGADSRGDAEGGPGDGPAEAANSWWRLFAHPQFPKRARRPPGGAGRGAGRRAAEYIDLEPARKGLTKQEIVDNRRSMLGLLFARDPESALFYRQYLSNYENADAGAYEARSPAAREAAPEVGAPAETAAAYERFRVSWEDGGRGGAGRGADDEVLQAYAAQAGTWSLVAAFPAAGGAGEGAAEGLGGPGWPRAQV